MNSFKKIRVLILVALTYVLLLTPSYQINNKDLFSKDKKSANLNNSGFWNLTGSPIYINDADPNYNWIKIAAENDWCYYNNSSSKYIIENIYLNGEGSGNCILIENSNQPFIIRNCEIDNSGSDYIYAGIKLINSFNGFLINNNISNSGNGIFLYNSDYNILRENNINNNSNDGIRIEGSNNNIIQENFAKKNEFSGLIIINNCFNNTALRNTLLENNRGILLYNSYECVIIKNNIECRDSSCGILLTSSVNNTISENHLKKSENGISLSYSDNNLLVGNIFENNLYENLDLNYCNYNNVTENIFLDNRTSWSDIRLRNSDNNRIFRNNKNNISSAVGLILYICYNNEISENNFQTISISNSGYNSISKNNVTGRIRLSVSNKNIISQNTVNGLLLRTPAIYLTSCQNNSVWGNLVNYSASNGINTYTCKNSKIINNIINACDFSGISISSTNKAVISGNIINNCQSNGVSLTSSNNTLVSNNTITSNYCGVILVDSANSIISRNVIENSVQNGVSLYGLEPSISRENLIFSNYLRGNGKNANDDGENNRWDNGSIGNYWSDYLYKDTDDNGIGDNPYNISGTAGTQDNYPLWWDAPVIFINSPITNSTFEQKPSFDISITEGVTDTTWYSLDNGVTNITFTGLTGDIDQGEWDKLPNGPTKILFFANDSKGFIGQSEIQVIKNVSIPKITNIAPNLSKVFGFIAPEFNITIEEFYPIDSMWYTLNGGMTKYNFSGLSGSINQSAWNELDDGFVILQFCVKDSAGNIGFKEIEIIKDTIDPIIIIKTPIHNRLYGVKTFNFNVTIIESNLQEKWYSLNEGQNITFTSETQFDQIEWDKIGSGIVLIVFYAKDKAGNLNSSEVMVRKDAHIPEIFIYSPLEDEIFGNTAPKFNISIIEEDLILIWYVIEEINTEFIISELIGSIDQDIWKLLPQGNFTITFYAQDIVGNIGAESVTVTKIILSHLKISGYNIFLLIGMISVISTILIRCKRKYNSFP
ncbi:MAG: NosD domain-containing protein [Candidatus Hodarchaeota archaeon]